MSVLLEVLFGENGIVKQIDDAPSDNAFCTSSMSTHASTAVLQDVRQQLQQQQSPLQSQSQLLQSQSQSQGMIMYMDGFRFSLRGNNPCINLYFSAWTLDTRAKFWWAMMGVGLLGIATEGISKLRLLLGKRLSGNSRRWTMTLLHVMQAFVGYILMLATMTLSIELLISVIVGLGLGFVIFYDVEDMHVPNNPCCNFIQDEVNERASTRRQQTLDEEHNEEEHVATNMIQQQQQHQLGLESNDDTDITETQVEETTI